MTAAEHLQGVMLGAYRVEQLIGRGGFGSVYKGVHEVFGTTVAIKVLGGGLASSTPKLEEQFAGLLKEARTHKALTHPFILPLLDAGKQMVTLDAAGPQWILYMIMEYAPGGSLRDRLSALQGQPLPLSEALAILQQIGQALHYAHEQSEQTIVHRDLKPENILFNARGEALLADFGLATDLPALFSVVEVKAAGTPHYMAPEQFDDQASPQSDQYALGCIAYELLTGQRIFPGNALGIVWGFWHKTRIPTAPGEINPQIPPHINQAVLKALGKERADRHDSVLAFLKALEGSHSSKNFTEWYSEGHACYEAGDYPGALHAYQQALLLQPDFAPLYFNRGQTMLKRRNYEQAASTFRQAIKRDPTNVLFYLQCGISLSRAQKFTEAIEIYQKILELDPGDQEAYLYLGHAHYSLKNYPEAARAYKQALGFAADERVSRQSKGWKGDPQEAETYMDLGLALKYCHKPEEALEALACAIELAPDLAEAHYNRGNVLSGQRKITQALKAFDQAIQLKPAYPRAHRARSKILYALGRSLEARLAEEQAQQLEHPES